jgi:hypothetical protein
MEHSERDFGFASAASHGGRVFSFFLAGDTNWGYKTQIAIEKIAVLLLKHR